MLILPGAGVANVRGVVPEHALLSESIDGEGPFGAKEVGQGPLLPMPPAVANAVYDAVGVRCTDLPLKPEKLRELLRKRQSGEPARVGSV